jgi:hypothetical protein
VKVSGACLDEIATGGGNLGVAAVAGCSTEGLAAWFAHWTYSLHAKLWEGAPMIVEPEQTQHYTRILERYETSRRGVSKAF